MKNLEPKIANRSRPILTASLILLCGCFGIFAANPLVNRIEGQVYNAQRQPLNDIRVELTGEMGTFIGSTKTTSSGRFSFSGMPAGRYSIRVLPLLMDLEEQTQEVNIVNPGRAMSDIAYVDFYLKPRKRMESEFRPYDKVVFVQQIPAAAEDLYRKGADEVDRGSSSGLHYIERSLEIFPTYFDALALLGKYHILRGDYEKGYPYLIRAIDVNPRSFYAYFRLGFAFYRLRQYPAALEAARAATTLGPSSSDARALYGTLLRISGRYSEAETHLLKANELAKEKEPEIHMQLALLYIRTGKLGLALDELRIYSKLAPDAPDLPKVKEMISKLEAAPNISR
jgi:tetratricopeptide (TPR) repeat protein